MITQAELQRIANKKKVRDKQIEKDYVLSWVLYGISQEPFLKDNLVFKGGTALKKFHFDDYRFSEDLDFTLINNNIEPNKIIECFKKSFLKVKQQSNIDLEIKDYETNKHGDLCFYVNFVGPLKGGLGTRNIKVDITYNELIINKAEELSIFKEYSDIQSLDIRIQVYSLKEVFIEKLCALIGRTQPRDLYDLWYLLEESIIDLKEEWNDFLEKAKSKKIEEPNILYTLSRKEKTFERMWDNFLAHQMHNLPHFNEVLRSTRKYFRET